MTIYFFNVRDGTPQLNREGVELAGVDAAKAEALQLATQLIRERGKAFWKSGEWAMDVTDHTGLILFALEFTGTDAPVIRQ